MERIEIIKTLLRERRISLKEFSHFYDGKYEYSPGQPLYMREAHFIAAVMPEGSTGTEIAQKLHVSLGSVSQTANMLEKRGLIIRKKSESDKRQSLFFLTEQGKEIHDSHAEYDERSFHNLSKKLSQYSDEELEAFIDYERNMAKLLPRRG